MDTMVKSIEDMKKKRDELNKEIENAEEKLKRCVQRNCRISKMVDSKATINSLIGQYYVVIPKEMVEIININGLTSLDETIRLVDRNTLIININHSSTFNKSVEKYLEFQYEHKLRSIEILIDNWEHSAFEATAEELIELIKRECQSK